jgi:hypothetical protein
MIKYAIVLDEETGLASVGLGDDTDYYKSIGMASLDVEQSEKDNNWYIAEKCPHYTPKEKEEMEKERIGNLQCTKRVFVLMLEQLGLDYFEQIEPAINVNRQAKLEWELCVELQRKNPLLDQLATQFGVTSKQLDDLFKFANGEITQQQFLGGN